MSQGNHIHSFGISDKIVLTAIDSESINIQGQVRKLHDRNTETQQIMKKLPQNKIHQTDTVTSFNYVWEHMHE